MRRSLALCVLALLLSFPASGEVASSHAPNTVPADAKNDARLIRYGYGVSWTGGSVLAPEGVGGVSVWADLAHDQQRLNFVGNDGGIKARLFQQDRVAFGAAAGEELTPTFDLMVGMQMLGVPVGLGTFVDWAQGKDGRGPLEQASISYGEDGMPVRLEENGWHIEYAAWTTAQGLGVPVPSLWTVKHNTGISMTLVLVASEAYTTDTLPGDYSPIQVR